MTDKKTRYRIVSNYGYGDKHWAERGLSENEVREYFVKNSNWTKEDFDEVGIQHFMNDDFIHYVEIDNENDKED